jgi:hypothetical protein
MFGWDRNPLRRRVDRVEAAVLAGLIMVFLIGTPVLVAGAGHWARAAGMRALRTQASGLIATSPAAAVGGTARIWVSRSGSPTGAPRGRSELLGWTPMAEVGVALVLALMFFLAVRLQRWLFERSRLACWHRAWRAQGPRWTGHR